MSAGLAVDPLVATSHESQDALPRHADPAPHAAADATVTAPTRHGSEHSRPSVSAGSRRRNCKFYASRQGCKAGSSCPFRHDQQAAGRALPHGPSDQDPGSGALRAPEKPTPSSAPFQRYTKPGHAVVERPIAPIQLKDPRAFQLNQIVRRYAAEQEDDAEGGTVLRFALAPSDPDFPFDLRAVDCSLRLPPGFPDRVKPTLRVSNKEMERGYQLNIERGFDAIWSELRQKTLLNAAKLLDRRLESLLTAQKAEFITIVSNSAPQQQPKPATKPPPPDPADRRDPSQRVAPPAKPRPPPPPSFQRVEEARAKRKAETKSLEHRLGRESAFVKEADGSMYSLPIEPRKRNDLPQELRPIKSVRLYVPESYDLEPCSVELLGVDGPACRNAEASFARRAHERRELSLMAHVNYLAQNLHIMASEEASPPAVSAIASDEAEALIEQSAETNSEDEVTGIIDTEKDHVKVIQRPVEWDMARDRNGQDSTSDIDDYYGSSDLDNSASDEKETDFIDTAAQPRESGVMVSIPGLELFNVELLEVASLSVTVKCGRCKDGIDFRDIKPSDEAKPTANARTNICRKCSLDVTVSFRGDLMHASSHRAGYLDLDNCEPLAILPSHFLPTCANCSTTHAKPGVVSTTAASDSLAFCRGCHGRMLFKLPQVHFLRVGPAVRLAGALPRRPNKRRGEAERVKLGIVPGTELPRRGTCPHYRKSFRWFRFGCCEKIYPCDRCHDESPEGGAHPQEFANRIVCGWCSREQRYRPEDCGFCGKSLVGKKGRGFWEGGKGTRNPAQMSRKDPRKYKLGTKIKLEQQKAKEKNER